MKKIVTVLVLVAMVLSFTILFCGCGHEHDMAESVIKEATCTETGIIKHFCQTCDYSFEETVEPLGHNYDNGTVIVEKTCTTDGKKEYVCKSCNDKKEEIIPAGHIFNEEIIREATCSSNGEKVKTCSLCGYSKTEKIEKKTHSFANNKCIYCDAVRVDLDADSWYHYTDLPYLNVQNCIVSNAVPLSHGVMVSYYPVCRSCHIASNILQLGGPEYNYDVIKNYVCPDCGATTRIQLKLSN